MDNLLPRRRSKKRLIQVWVSLALLLLVLVLAVKFAGSIWLNGQRAQLERILTDATGFKTRINGTVTATLFPTPGVSLGGISMEYNGKTVVAASGFDANFDLLPLFARQLVPHEVNIDGLWLQLPADELGRPALAFKAGKTSATVAGTPFGLQIQVPDRIELHNSTIVVSTPKNKELHYIKGLNLAVYPVHNRLALLSNRAEGPDDEWRLQLYMNFEQAKFDRLDTGSARLEARFGPRSGTAKINKANVFDGIANGDLGWKYDGEVPEYQANLTLTDFDAGKSVLLFRSSSFVQGRLNVSTNLSGKGSTREQLLASVSGSVKMEGANLDLVSTNLDELVNNIIRSKQYNLADAVAYFFIGPFAVSATKGLDVARASHDLTKTDTVKNRIKRIHTSWQLSDGIASAKDVALQTERYLLALRGRVNLSKQTFENIEIGVINNQGCAIATQKFYGPIASPSMEKANLLVTLTRPLLDALTKSAKGIIDTKCNSPFYKGVLLPKTTSQPAPTTEATEGQKPAATESTGETQAPASQPPAQAPASQPPAQAPASQPPVTPTQ